MTVTPAWIPWVPHLWLIAGLILCALELMVAGTGVGFLFAGLAAITTAIVIYLEWADTASLIAQFAWFFGMTCVWAALLWKPMQTMRTQKAHMYSDMVGSTATVLSGGLTPEKTGQVRWSGTIMRARLAPGNIEPLRAETVVKVIAVDKGVLVVEPE